MQLQDVRQRNKDLDEELFQEKNMWESIVSKLTDELNKTKEELQKDQDGLKLAEAELQKVKVEQI